MNHGIFVKLNLPIFVVLVGQREKSQKYFDLSTFNHNLYDSNPWSSLGVMNFQKWELFSGSPGRVVYDVLLLKLSALSSHNSQSLEYVTTISDGLNSNEIF